MIELQIQRLKKYFIQEWHLQCLPVARDIVHCTSLSHARVWGSGPRGLVFAFQPTINALCAPAWRKNQSSRLPRQKGPVLSAENPDVNWPWQIPARKKKINIFVQSKRSCHVGFWISFLISQSLNNSDLSREVTSFLMSLLAFLDSSPDGEIHHLAHHNMSSSDQHTLSCSLFTRLFPLKSYLGH